MSNEKIRIGDRVKIIPGSELHHEASINIKAELGSPESDELLNRTYVVSEIEKNKDGLIFEGGIHIICVEPQIFGFDALEDACEDDLKVIYPPVKVEIQRDTTKEDLAQFEGKRVEITNFIVDGSIGILSFEESDHLVIKLTETDDDIDFIYDYNDDYFDLEIDPKYPYHENPDVLIYIPE